MSTNCIICIICNLCKLQFVQQKKFIYHYSHILNAYYDNNLILISIIICVLFRLSESVLNHKFFYSF